jgi:hypothetical protein
VTRRTDHPMTEARYRATVAKLHRAWMALAEAGTTAEFFQGERIAVAMDALARVPDQLRVQVCRHCSKLGYYPKPGDPYVAVSCDHPQVPRYSVKTGEVISS